MCWALRAILLISLVFAAACSPADTPGQEAQGTYQSTTTDTARPAATTDAFHDACDGYAADVMASYEVASFARSIHYLNNRDGLLADANPVDSKTWDPTNMEAIEHALVVRKYARENGCREAAAHGSEAEWGDMANLHDAYLCSHSADRAAQQRAQIRGGLPAC